MTLENKVSTIWKAAINGLASIGVAMSLSSPSEAKSLQWDVTYLTHKDISAVQDYREEVENCLGSGVERDLHLVQTDAGNYRLVYDRNGSKEQAEKTAQRHRTALRKCDLDSAVAIPDKGYHELYNVVYGKGPNLKQLKRDFSVVYKLLGSQVGKNLGIEQVNGDYALVWKRQGEKQSTHKISQKHSRILRRKGIGASIIREDNNPIVFGESSHMNEEEPPQKPKVKRPETRRQAVSSNLESAIENHIKRLRQRGSISGDEKTAWSVYDFETGEKLVSINEDVPLQSASMIKPLVALAYFHQVKQGKLMYGPKSKKHLRRMIQRSNNQSTNWVMQQLGGPRAVQRILRRNYGAMLPETSIVERIPPGGRTYRNKSSAHDYSRFLYALWNNDLPSSREIRRLMALPGRDRLYSGAKNVPTGTLVYNKTGSTARLCGDMGILYARGRDGSRKAYTLIGIIEKGRRTGNYGNWISRRGNVIRGVSNLVYKHMKGKHRLR